MTRDEHYMTIAMEECNEVAHRIAKAMRFGMEQVQEDPDDKPEQNPERHTNRERIAREFYQLRAMIGLIGIDAWTTSEVSRACERAKVDKVIHYLERSRANGTLTVPGLIGRAFVKPENA